MFSRLRITSLTNYGRLKSWLADNTPRVIMIDKTFNFLGSEGSVTETGCRLTSGCTAANGGQDTIKSSGCDSNEKPIQVKYDKASHLGMPVGSNKSLVGVGNKGVLLGKGLRFNAGAKNIIIQNIHIDVGFLGKLRGIADFCRTSTLNMSGVAMVSACLAMTVSGLTTAR